MGHVEDRVDLQELAGVHGLPLAVQRQHADVDAAGVVVAAAAEQICVDVDAVVPVDRSAGLGCGDIGARGVQGARVCIVVVDAGGGRIGSCEIRHRSRK